MANDLIPVSRPARPLLLTELPRAVAEGAAIPSAWPILRRAPRGDGHAVVTISAIAGDDATGLPLKLFLRYLGYDATGWDHGMSFGTTRLQRDKLEAFVAGLFERSGRKVSLIGHSIAGTTARELARARPDMIRQVITLGTPLGGSLSRETNIWPLVEALTGVIAPEVSTVAKRRLATAPLVPSTSVYSRTDGVVDWKACIQTPGLGSGTAAENVEVRSSHAGMMVNPSVLYVVADRLAQPEFAWAPFERKGWRVLAFPKPAKPRRR